MAKFRLSAIAAATAMTTVFAANAFAINSKADCEYQGGEAFDINGEQICVIPIRAEEFHGEEYDDAQLGVKVCEGDLIGDGVFCRITLSKGKQAVSTPADAATMADKAVDAVKTDATDKVQQPIKKVIEKAKD